MILSVVLLGRQLPFELIVVDTLTHRIENLEDLYQRLSQFWGGLQCDLLQPVQPIPLTDPRLAQDKIKGLMDSDVLNLRVVSIYIPSKLLACNKFEHLSNVFTTPSPIPTPGYPPTMMDIVALPKSQSPSMSSGRTASLPHAYQPSATAVRISKMNDRPVKGSGPNPIVTAQPNINFPPPPKTPPPSHLSPTSSYPLPPQMPNSNVPASTSQNRLSSLPHHRDVNGYTPPTSQKNPAHLSLPPADGNIQPRGESLGQGQRHQHQQPLLQPSNIAQLKPRASGTFSDGGSSGSGTLSFSGGQNEYNRYSPLPPSTEDQKWRF